jgi:hypothetical protein
MKLETRLSILLVPMLLIGSVAFSDTLTFSGQCSLEHPDSAADIQLGAFNVEAKELEEGTQNIPFTIPGSKDQAYVFINFDRRRKLDELGMGYRWREYLNGFVTKKENYTFITQERPNAITPGISLNFRAHLQYIIHQNQIHQTGYYLLCSGRVR